MKHVKTVLLIVIGLSLAFALMGCGEVGDIPPGYIGKIRTPTGWEKKTRESSQPDLGQLGQDGSGNRLVICEATSTTIKETFAKEKDTDHRIITKDKVPLTVDIYTQVMIPEDQELRDSIFAQVTPSPLKGKKRTDIITLQDIYDRFAKMTIRGKTREIFAKYDSYAQVMDNYPKINAEVSAMIADTFKRNLVPLDLIAGQLSNVKVDEVFLSALNDEAAATARANAIKTEGAAIQSNPGYLDKYKWDTLREIVAKDPNVTIIVNEGDGGRTGYNIPIKK